MLRRLLVVGLASSCLLLPAAAQGRGRTRPSFAVPGQMRVVAYYPAADGWTYMWERWKPSQIDRDLGLIRGLRANTVRFFVQPVAFGYPVPTATASAKLGTLFALAAKHGLAVELTLFDWWFDYKQIAASETWVRDLLSPYAGDPRLAAVELRNELDPGNASAVIWAKQLLPFVRTVVPGTSVTLSVSANDPVRKLTLLSHELAPVTPDFWSFHYYDKPEYAYWTFAAAEAAVAPVPLVVGETGYQPSFSVPAAQTHAEADAERDRYFRTVMNAAALLGLPPPGIWVLLDFTPGGSPVPMPPVQYVFGLFRTDGAPKSAAAVVRAAFAAPGQLDTAFDGDFEQPGLGTWRASGAGVAARDTAVVHTGSGSAEIGRTGGSVTALTQIPPVPWVSPGQSVTLSAWVKGLAATGTTRVAVQWFASDRTALGEADSAPLPSGTTPWTQLTVQADAPAGAAFFSLELTSEKNFGSARFDDVSLAVGAP